MRSLKFHLMLETNLPMRKWWSKLAIVFTLLALLGLGIVWLAKRMLHEAKVENLHYTINSIGLKQLSFSEVSFFYTSGESQYNVQFDDLNIDVEWRNWLTPHLKKVDSARARLIQTPSPAPASKTKVTEPTTPFSLPTDWLIPDSFPEKISIQSLQLKFLCNTNQCSLTGELNISKPLQESQENAIDFKLIGNMGELRTLGNSISLVARYSAPKNSPILQLKVSAEDFFELQIDSLLNEKPIQVWSAQVKGTVRYPNEYWKNYLSTWNIQIVDSSAATTTTPSPTAAPNFKTASSPIELPALSIESQWQINMAPLLAIPSAATPNDWLQAASGQWSIDAKLPTPIWISLPDRISAKLSGHLNASLAIDAGKINRYLINTELKADQLSLPELTLMLGTRIDTASLELKSNQDITVDSSALPITLSTSTRGELQTHLITQAVLNLPARKIVFEKFDLEVSAKKLKAAAGVELTELKSHLVATGFLRAGEHFQKNSFDIVIAEPSQLTTNLSASFSAKLPEKGFVITAQSVSFSKSKLRISGELELGKSFDQSIGFDGQLNLNGKQFQHPAVKTKSWFWNGSVKGNLTDAEITGDFNLDNSINIHHQVTKRGGKLNASWKMADIYLLAANPFANMFTAWPEVLTLTRGKISSDGKVVLNLTKNEITQANAGIHLDAIAGIYDTFIFQGLDTNLQILVDKNKLTLSTDQINLESINQGFALGPLKTSGNYQTNLNSLLKGKLKLNSFNCLAMGGSIQADAKEFDLAQSSHSLNLQLDKINLTNLLKQYSSSELSGTGLLSGTIPLEINAKGIRIADGKMLALAPGGQLQMNSTRAESIAKNQPSMKLVVDALSDFHYSALSTQVDYNETGKLKLGIQLSGANPNVEKGRAINLNVNLEEDVPAMLASIQLSSKVSDIVKKRLQDRLKSKSKN